MKSHMFGVKVNQNKSEIYSDEKHLKNKSQSSTISSQYLQISRVQIEPKLKQIDLVEA